MTSSPTLGRYEVEKELGRGAMGVVWLARDPALGRDVAIKYLRPDLVLKPEEHQLLMKRMRQEAQALARISHVGIVGLYDVGESDDLGTYLVFEHAEGPTLEEAVRRGRLTSEGMARLAREMGDALDSAHSHGILHRDIKPGNVILTESGSRIADFGVARLPDSTLTRAGARVGTPAYSAPEAIRDGLHSAASDQFSMAACLYEGLSGRRAYPGDEAVEVAKLIEKESPSPIASALGLSPRVDEVLLKGMARTPEARFSSCRELGLALSAALLGVRELQPTLPDEQTLLRHDKESRSQKLGYAVLFTLIGATVGTGLVRLAVGRESKQSAKTAAQELAAPALRPGFLSPLPSRRK